MTTQQNTYNKDSNVKKIAGDSYPYPTGTIREDLESIKEDGANLAMHLKEDARHATESMVEDGQHKLADFKSFIDKYLRSMEKEVTAQPLKSMAIALGAGAVLSLLLIRR